MLNKDITQTATTKGDVFQAGQNITVYQSNLPSFDLYEDDIKEIIKFFSESIKNSSLSPSADFNAIDIKNKNLLNNVDDEYNQFIKDNSLPSFDKINSFLMHPANTEYRAMYEATALDLQQIILGNFNRNDSFSTVISNLYTHIVLNSKSDKPFMSLRTYVLVFLHFMYYNCDIGRKNLEGDEIVTT